MFSHGGSSDRRYWEPQRDVFAAHYRFVAYSRREVGDLAAVIEALAAGPAHIVGFSTAVALRTAVREPALVRTLTVVEPNVPWLLEGEPEDEAVLERWRDENRRVDAEAAGDRERAARLWFELVNNRGPGTFAAQPEALRRMWLDNFRRGASARPAAPVTREQLSAIAAPTLVLAAEHGMRYSRRISELVAECIPGARLEIIPGATHFMSYQHPARFNAAVLAFLHEHSG